MATMTYVVPEMSCGHCVAAVAAEVRAVAGVISVTADLASCTVTVSGDDFDDREVRAAIDEAGYLAE